MPVGRKTIGADEGGGTAGRTISAEGQALLIPEIEVQTWWINLAAPPEDVIRLYREHGTCEQFHSELKTDMDLERLPSGKFATDALSAAAGLMACNALRLCGQTSLREERRLYQAARWVRHGRRFGLNFGYFNPWFRVWRRTCLRVWA